MLKDSDDKKMFERLQGLRGLSASCKYDEAQS